MFDSGYILNVEPSQSSDWLCGVRKRHIKSDSKCGRNLQG